MGFLAMGLKLGVFWSCSVSAHVYLHAQTAVDCSYFDYGKNLNTPIWAPCQVLEYPLYICGKNIGYMYIHSLGLRLINAPHIVEWYILFCWLMMHVWDLEYTCTLSHISLAIQDFNCPTADQSVTLDQGANSRSQVPIMVHGNYLSGAWAASEK